MSILNLPLSSFLTPKQTISAPGSLGAIAAIPATRMAIILSPRLKENPTLKSIMEKSKRTKYRMIFAGWQGEPHLSDLQENLQELEEFKPDYITAIGGGRILDGAKLLWALYEHPNFEIERLILPFALPELRKKARLCLVPTTAGTGSEASSSALYTDEDTGKKIAVVTHDFIPDMALLDPELLIGLDEKQLCLSALDALSHTIEGSLSKVNNSLSQSLVPGTVQMIFKGLKQKGTDEDIIESLTSLLNAAYYAGIIQNTMLVGPAHAIAHQLGSYKVPHGLATGLLLPIVMKHLARRSETIQERYQWIAKESGFQDSRQLVEEIQKLPTMFDIPSKISKWDGVILNKIQIGEEAHQDNLSRVFPMEMDANQLQEIFEEAWN